MLIGDGPTLDLSDELLDGRYRLRERLGFGGAGVVYLAGDLQFPQRPVAVKVSCSTGVHEEQRFQDEIEVLGALRHPNLIVPLAWGRTPGGHLYLVMEYLRGQDLRTRLELGPLAARDVVILAIAVGEALLVLHAAGVLHRDIKPSNIILLEPGDASGILVKLIDLGVAKKDPERWPGTAARTPTNAAPGTPPYLPPEAGFVPPDPKLDVYGLGATLFEATTGRTYAAGAALGDLPAGLREIVTAALALNADARPTLAAMVADLVRLRDADPPGRLLVNRYELLRPLGRGAKGEVWLAAQRLTGRDVVIKRLHERATEEDALRLRHEVRVLAALQHPAFPTLLDAFEFEGRLHLVMTPTRGEPALTFTKDPLSQAQVIAVGIELMKGLVALHSLGVLHRDLHAENVMIDFEGPRGRPVVTILDLGMCELLPAWWARPMRYATPPEQRAQLGSARQETLNWSAPETASTGWTEKSDVWSAALLLCRLLTGRLPFAPRAKTILTCPRQYRPDCSRHLAEALLAMLQPDPTQRPGAAEFLERLRDVQALLTEDEGEEDVDEAPARAGSPPGEGAASPAASNATAVVPAVLLPSASMTGGKDSPAVAPSASPAAVLAEPAADDHLAVTPLASPVVSDRKDTRLVASRMRARRLALAGAAVLLGGLLVRNAPEPASPSAPRRTPVEAATNPPDVSARQQDAPERAPAEDTEPSAPPRRTPPSALAAIEAVRERLHRCSPATFTVEITTRAGEDHVDTIDVLGPSEASVCARELVTPLRFAPGAPEHVVLEVAP